MRGCEVGWAYRWGLWRRLIATAAAQLSRQPLGIKDKEVTWITKLSSVGHLQDAIIHFNRAHEADGKDVSHVEIVEYLSDALNKIQTEWSTHAANHDMGQVKSFQTMITKAINQEDQNGLLVEHRSENSCLSEATHLRP